MMKSFFKLLAVLLFSVASVSAQVRVVDATTNAPVSAASVFDVSGNMVGFTWSDGVLSDIPVSAYPITVRCMGYEQITIERAEDKAWPMNPIAYELEEVVIVPVERNVLKQLFYVREYFSMASKKDTLNFFKEHMADRFVPTSKDAKFRGDSSLRILTSRSYIRAQISGKDSIIDDFQSDVSMLSIYEFEDEEVEAPESFLSSTNTSKIYEEPGKSGPISIFKQNAQTFSFSNDVLAAKKNHTWSPWPLKLLGYTLEFNQFFFSQTYRVNDKGVYLPKDLLEASFVMEADGRGKQFRKILKSDEPIVIRCMIELYVVNNDYLSKDEAKDESKQKPTNIQFEIPSTIPALNKATQEIVDRAHAQMNKKQ